jgi:hypothetical protein
MQIASQLQTPSLPQSDNTLLARLLFLCICIMLVPFTVSPTPYPSVQLVASFYVSQILVMSVALLARGLRFSSSVFVALLTFTTVQLIAYGIQLLSLQSLPVEQQVRVLDVANIVAKFINIMLFVVLLTSHRITERAFNTFMDCIVYFGLFTCVANIAMYYNDLAGFRSMTSSYEINAKSVFTNRNMFAQYLVVAIIANTFRCAHGVTAFRAVAFSLLFVSLLLTMSRGSLLGVAVFGLSLCTMTTFRKHRYIIVGLTLGAIALTAMHPGVKWFVFDILLRADQGTTGRVEVWQAGWEVAFENNLFFGVGSFSGRELARLRGMEFCEFHSMYVDTLVSGGLFEVMFVCGLLLYVIARVLRSSMLKEHRSIYCCSMLAVFVMCFFESISFFSVGYVDTLYTVFYVSIPILASTKESS